MRGPAAPICAGEVEPVPSMLDGLSTDSTVGAGQLELDGRAEAPDFEMEALETDVTQQSVPDVDAKRTEPEQMETEGVEL